MAREPPSGEKATPVSAIDDSTSVSDGDPPRPGNRWIAPARPTAMRLDESGENARSLT